MNTIPITRLGHLGDGVAEDGSLHALTLPGDLVHADGSGAVEPRSVHRVPPVCAHFGQCGGCGLQHASDDFLAAWRREQVAAALRAQGIEAGIGAVHVSPSQSRRRAVFSARRTRKTVQLGFHRRGSDAIEPISECHVLLPGMLDLRPALAALARLGGSRKGEVKIAVTASRAGWDVELRDAKPLDLEMRAELAAIADASDLARLTCDGELIAMRRPPVQKMGRAQVVPPPGAFLQATDAGEAQMVALVARHAAGAGRIVDLFSGCGTFALPLAERADVLAVEGSAPLLAALDAAWRGTEGLRRIDTACRDLFRRPLLPAELAGFDAAVIDPPRAGAEAQMRALAEARLPRIVAVSCNPVTFARDARILVDAGYAPGPIDIIDQFRWSPHIELVAPFSRR